VGSSFRIKETSKTVTRTKIEIGNRIRLLRVQQQRTLADIAAMCQFTPSLLSKIENGKILPSVGTLIKIADALGTSVNAIIESETSNTVIYTSREKTYESLITTHEGLNFFPFATERKQNLIHPMLHIRRKGKHASRPDSHAGQEFVFILKGTLKFKVGANEYILKEGDSVYFDAIEKHMCIPVTAEVEYLDIFA
jgi:transcriptional regulator with XRE-family HTH domain